MTYNRYNRRPYARTSFSAPLHGDVTEAQHGKITSLMAEINAAAASAAPDAVQSALAAINGMAHLARLIGTDWATVSKAEASETIGALIEVSKALTASVPSPYVGLPGHDRYITTRFAGDCAGCGRRTVAGTDLAVLRSGRWEPWCIACATADPAERAAREAAQRAAAEAERARLAAERDALNVLTGVAVGLARTAFAAMGMDSHQRPMLRFALPSATGNNDLDFFTVSVTSHRGVANGVRVCRVIGGHADQPLALAQGVEALKRLTDGDIVAACRLYGQHLGYCCRCGRHLTDEASRKAGIGPDCATR